jgi:Fe(3+) dicitrate transport protein
LLASLQSNLKLFVIGDVFYICDSGYDVADFSTSYKWKKWKLEAGITNFTNNSYFTRRATGYPGPGIILSDTRTFYTTLEFVF